jgi:acetyltransferase
LNRQKLAQFELHHDKDHADEIIQKCMNEGQTYLGELDGLEILQCYGFKILPTILAENENQAMKIADGMGYPVVMKIVSPQIIHKSDAGGVKVGMKTREDVRTTFTEIISNAKAYNPDARIQGVLVQRLAPSGNEVILGMNRYKGHGPLVMFGLGGVFVELFKDVVFRLAPIGRNNARRMVRSIKSFPLLNGFRGKPKADLEIIHKLLVSLSDLVINHPEIKELDINPLLVHPEGKGATVADVRIILSSPEPE